MHYAENVDFCKYSSCSLMRVDENYFFAEINRVPFVELINCHIISTKHASFSPFIFYSNISSITGRSAFVNLYTIY